MVEKSKKKIDANTIVDAIKGFFNFNEMYTEKVVKIGYALGVVVLLYNFFKTIRFGFSRTLLIFILGNIGLRLGAEFLLILFEINNKLK